MKFLQNLTLCIFIFLFFLELGINTKGYKRFENNNVILYYMLILWITHTLWDRLGLV